MLLMMYMAMLDTERDKLLFCEIYNEYEKSLFKAALSMCRHVENAEDLLQNTFIRVAQWINKHHKVPEENLYAWLITVMRNELIDDSRKKNAKMQFESIEDIGEIPVGDFSAESLDKLSFEELIVNLSDLDKDILRFKFFFHYNSSEIADVLGMKPETVRKRTERIMVKLREYYKEEEYCV